MSGVGKLVCNDTDYNSIYCPEVILNLKWIDNRLHLTENHKISKNSCRHPIVCTYVGHKKLTTEIWILMSNYGEIRANIWKMADVYSNRPYIAGTQSRDRLQGIYLKRARKG